MVSVQSTGHIRFWFAKPRRFVSPPFSFASSQLIHKETPGDFCPSMKIYETQQGTVIDLTTDDESAKRKDDGGPPPIVIDHLSTSGDEEEEAAQTAGPVTRSQSRQGQSKKKRSRDPQLTVELSDSEDEGKNSSSRIGTSPASQKRWKRGIQRVEEDLAAKKNGNDRSLRLKIQEEEELEKQRRELQELWQKEKERLKLERLEKECREKERLELERLEKERERLELERREQERRQNELKRLEKIRKEKERLELERLDKVRKEKERLELERLEKERKEQEARNHQKRLGEEQKAMTESSEGKATRLVEKLVSFMEEYKAKKQADIAQRIDLIAIDDLWLVAKRFFDQQDLFLSEGVSPQIILGKFCMCRLTV